MKIFEIQNNDSDYSTNLIVDSNTMEGPDANVFDPWKFSFNPRNNS
jgi:hypothetical protein